MPEFWLEGRQRPDHNLPNAPNWQMMRGCLALKVCFARCNPVIRMAWIKCGYCTFGDMGRWQYEGNLTTFVSPKYMICNNMHFFIYLYIHTYVESKGDKYKRLGF